MNSPAYISLKDVVFSRSGRRIFDGVSLDIPRGKITAINVYVSIDGVIWDTTTLLQPYVYTLDAASNAWTVTTHTQGKNTLIICDDLIFFVS